MENDAFSQIAHNSLKDSKFTKTNVTIVFYGKNYISIGTNEMGSNDALGDGNHGI